MVWEAREGAKGSARERRRESGRRQDKTDLGEIIKDILQLPFHPSHYSLVLGDPLISRSVLFGELFSFTLGQLMRLGINGRREKAHCQSFGSELGRSSTKDGDGRIRNGDLTIRAESVRSLTTQRSARSVQREVGRVRKRTGTGFEVQRLPSLLAWPSPRRDPARWPVR